MAVKIKLKRLGKIRSPQYRIIIADARNKRDGRAIEEIGKYHPKEEPSFIEVDSERVQYWLGVGAQPTEPVLSILKVTGDWQQFKGLPGAEGTLRVADDKADKKAVYEAALAEVHGESKKADATTPKKKAKKSEAKKATDDSADAATADAEEKPAKKAAAKKSAPKADEAKADEAKADDAKADEAKADEVKADDAKADETKADDAKADDAKADETKADDAKADDAKADDAKADDAAENA